MIVYTKVEKVIQGRYFVPPNAVKDVGADQGQVDVLSPNRFRPIFRYGQAPCNGCGVRGTYLLVG